jgi:hypothetical protein
MKPDSGRLGRTDCARPTLSTPPDEFIGCRTAAFLAEAFVASRGQVGRPLRAATILKARPETLRDFTGRTGGREACGRRERFFRFGGPNQKIFPSRVRRRKSLRAWRRQREPQISRLCLDLPSSRPPCEKISIARGDRGPLQELLRFRAAAWQPHARRYGEAVRSEPRYTSQAAPAATNSIIV